MKRIIILLLLVLSGFITKAQVTTLNQDFNTLSCPISGIGYPGDWREQNYIAPLDTLAWHCTSTDGKNGTGGMFCTGYINGSSRIDTAYFITPLLDISSYIGSVYIQFDSKTDNLISSSMGLIPSHDSIYTNIDSNTIPPVPAFSSNDVAGWVTHQVDITSQKADPFYFAFKYASDLSTANVWYIDNVLITGTQLNVTNIQKGIIPISVIGNSSSDQLKLFCKTQEDGLYNLTIYDILGHEVHKQTLNIQSGSSIYTLSGLDLPSGMYFIKMGNDTHYGTVKTIIQ